MVRLWMVMSLEITEGPFPPWVVPLQSDVAVPPSKTTLSEAVGIGAVFNPPKEFDQLVICTPLIGFAMTQSQFAFTDADTSVFLQPPTQYLALVGAKALMIT